MNEELKSMIKAGEHIYYEEKPDKNILSLKVYLIHYYHLPFFGQ